MGYLSSTRITLTETALQTGCWGGIFILHPYYTERETGFWGRIFIPHPYYTDRDIVADMVFGIRNVSPTRITLIETALQTGFWGGIFTPHPYYTDRDSKNEVVCDQSAARSVVIRVLVLRQESTKGN